MARLTPTTSNNLFTRVRYCLRRRPFRRWVGFSVRGDADLLIPLHTHDHHSRNEDPVVEIERHNQALDDAIHPHLTLSTPLPSNHRHVPTVCPQQLYT